MFNKIINKIKNIMCQHNYVHLNRWYLINDNQVEAHYICDNCNKSLCVNLFNKEATEWKKMMGVYKYFGGKVNK